MAGFYAARSWIIPPLPWLDLQAPLPAVLLPTAPIQSRTLSAMNSAHISHMRFSLAVPRGVIIFPY